MKKALTLVGLIGLILLGAGLFLGHKTIGKLEQSHSKIIAEKDNMINELKAQIQAKEAELAKIKQDKTAVSAEENAKKEEEKNQGKLVAELLSQSQKNLLLEEEIKILSGKMTELVEKCTIKPIEKKKIAKKPVKSVYHVEKTVVKPIEKKIEPMTIIINKVYVSDKGGTQKLIKSEKKVIPKTYYPNDLLK